MGDDLSAQILDLVSRIAARPPPRRVVTPEEYRAIACNRCGVCCEDIRAPAGPEEIDALADDPSVDEERRAFLSGWIFVEQARAGWRYRCRHFFRDADGLGTCDIHDTRPAVCRWFPGGYSVRAWPQCAWYVEVQDEQGNLVEFVPAADPIAAAPDR